MINNLKIAEWVLRIAVAGEFIGHGVFALQGKKDWIGWFAKFGISDPEIACKVKKIGLAGSRNLAFLIRKQQPSCFLF